MGQDVATREKYMNAGSGVPIAPYLRVVVSGSPFQFSLAGANQVDHGVLYEEAITQASPYMVILPNGPGTVKMTAAGAITQGADVYAAAGGKITSTVGGVPIGIALQAASGNGSIIEVLRVKDAGLRTVGGVGTLTGTSPLAIVTGLSTIVAATASFQIVGGAAPGLDPIDLSVDFGGSVTAGTLDIYPYKATSSSNPTLEASTNSSALVAWSAVGY